MGRTEHNPPNTSPKQSTLLEKIDRACSIYVKELRINNYEQFSRKSLIYEICKLGVRREPKLHSNFHGILVSAAGLDLDNFDESRRQSYQNLSNLLNLASTILLQHASNAEKTDLSKRSFAKSQTDRKTEEALHAQFKQLEKITEIDGLRLLKDNKTHLSTLLVHVASSFAPKKPQTQKALERLQWLCEEGDVNTSPKAQKYASDIIKDLCTGLSLEHDLKILDGFKVSVNQFVEEKNQQRLRVVQFRAKQLAEKLYNPAESADFDDLTSLLNTYRLQAPSMRTSSGQDASKKALEKGLSNALMLSYQISTALESQLLEIGND